MKRPWLWFPCGRKRPREGAGSGRCRGALALLLPSAFLVLAGPATAGPPVRGARLAGMGGGMALTVPPNRMSSFTITGSGTPAAMGNSMPGSLGNSASNLLRGGFTGTLVGQPFFNPYAGLARGLGYGAAGSGGYGSSPYGASYGGSGYAGGGYGSAGYGNPSSSSSYGGSGLSPYAYLSSNSGYGTASSGARSSGFAADPNPSQGADANTGPGRQERQERQQPSAKGNAPGSRKDPPATEIQSARALNASLAELQRLQARDIRGPFFPLDQQVLRQIHVAPGPRASRLLKAKGRLAWPPPLGTPAPERERLSRLLEQAIARAEQGTGRPADLYELSDAVANLHARLAADAGTLPAPQVARARRFLNDLDDVLRVLGQPDAGEFLHGQYVAKGETVEELVLNMMELGLRFAPAVGGDEAAYAALYRDLADYQALCRSP